MLVAEGTLFARQDPAYWIDAGTPESYLQVQFDLQARVRGTDAHVAASAEIAPSATIERSVVMAGAVVAADATVRGSTLLPGARVERAACVVDSIVGWGATVGAGARLDGLCVLGEGVTVTPGEQLTGERRPSPPPG